MRSGLNIRAVGNDMIAAKKSSGKSNTEMFDDVPVLQRKWQAALRPGEGLPRYEDVMLGSLGRLADHIVLLKSNHDTLEVSRTGRYAQKWLGRRPLGYSAERAAAGLRDRAQRSRGQRASQRPSLSRHGALRARRRGPDLRYPGAADILALGRHADRRLRQRAWTHSTICWMRFFPAPTKASCRSRRSAIPPGSRSISRSSITIRARHGC